MALEIFLVLVQVASGITLGALSFIPSFIKPEGGLTSRGWRTFIVGAVILIGSTATIQFLSARSARLADQRLDQLMQTLVQCVMLPSAGTAQPPPPASTGRSLWISRPNADTTVQPTSEIRGQVSDRVSEVWVVVHPLGTSSYWVQPRVSWPRTGEWQTTGYFGRVGAVDGGKGFEILAVGDPANDLREGAILDQWPSARLVSDVVRVQRN
jgi:hypothetical protein